MTTLKEISKQLEADFQAEDKKELENITKELLNPLAVPRYPFNLFVMKFYLPFRALVEFDVDTVQMGSKLKNGEITSSLYRDWMSICVLPSNKVALTDTRDTNKIMLILPPINQSLMLKGSDTKYTNVDMNQKLFKAAEKMERGDQRAAYLTFQSVGKEIEDTFDLGKHAVMRLKEEWRNALNEVDKIRGVSTESEIARIADILEIKKEENNRTVNNDIDAFD